MLLDKNRDKAVPITRKNGTFAMEVFVEDKENKLETPKKVCKQKTVPMEVDNVENNNRWKAFGDDNSGFPRLVAR